MRISDWSSDVCSSDLFARSQLDIDCNYVAANNAFLAIHDPGVQLGCTSNSTVYDRNDTRKQARADFEWSLGDHLLRFGYDHEDDTSDYSRHYAGPRSEEHTSELQSLMRNSYAVFCLKKKKKKT